jgi:non-ribosomal peptide synthetase component E (peptide arylation enzyme)
MLTGDFLRDSATGAPDRVALIGRGQRLTYAQFDEQANRLANALLDLRLVRNMRSHTSPLPEHHMFRLIVRREASPVSWSMC